MFSKVADLKLNQSIRQKELSIIQYIFVSENSNKQKNVNMENNDFQSGKVIIVSISHFLHDVYSSFLAPILPLLIEKFALTYFMSGLLTFFQRIPNLLNPFIGLIADKVQIRYFIIVSPAVTAVSMSLLGVAPHYTMLAILLFVMGISAALFHIPAPVMIKKISGKYTGKGMSFYMLGGELARTSGPLIITAAVSLWGLEGTYKLIPFGLLASFILFLKVRKIRIREDIDMQNLSGLKITVKKYAAFFLLITGIIFFRAVMKSGLSAFLPTYLEHDKGYSLWFANTAFAVWQLGGVFGTFISGTISDKIGRKTSLVIITSITPILMFLFTVVNDFYLFPVLFILGFFIIAPGPVFLALVQDLDADRPSFINSIYITISFLVGMITVIVSGAISDWIGLETTFKISAFLAIGSVPIVLALKKR